LNLFWKDKQNSSEIFSYESNDRRTYFRIYPAENEPVFFLLGGKKVQVIDISAGGLSFKAKDLKMGDFLSVEFVLPHQNASVSALLKIKSIDRRNICHCRFNELGEDEIEAIHQYVLIRQKEMICERKPSIKKLS